MTLEKWRHLLEPELSSCFASVAWSDLCAMRDLTILERANSVLVLKPIQGNGLSILVACGVMDEVLDMVNETERIAKDRGFKKVVFIGRRGWVRMLPTYTERSVIVEKVIV